jgi:hypothetical protein
MGPSISVVAAPPNTPLIIRNEYPPSGTCAHLLSGYQKSPEKRGLHGTHKADGQPGTPDGWLVNRVVMVLRATRTVHS